MYRHENVPFGVFVVEFPLDVLDPLSRFYFAPSFLSYLFFNYKSS